MKKIFSILLIMVLFTATPVFADTKLFQADDSLTLQENLSGTAFVAGNQVTSTNEVDGILFAAGNIANISSTSEYAFIAGNFISLDNASFRDGFIAGNEIKINTSNIERDLYVAGSRVALNSDVGRHAYIGGEEVVVDSVINGNLTIYATNIVINSNTVVTGTLKYSEASKITISKDANIGNTEIVKESAKPINEVKINTGKSIYLIVVEKISSWIFSSLNLLLVALIMIFLFPRLFEAIHNNEKNSIIVNAGIGLLSLIVIPIVAIIIMITGVGVATGLLSIIFYGVFIYVSSILAAYYFGSMFLGEKIKNKYLLLIVSILILKLLTIIPFIKILVSLFALCVGLGIIIRLVFKRK